MNENNLTQYNDKITLVKFNVNVKFNFKLDPPFFVVVVFVLFFMTGGKHLNFKISTTKKIFVSNSDRYRHFLKKQEPNSFFFA